MEEKTGNSLPILSYSKISTFKRCPKCYKFTYIDKLPKPPPKDYNIFGSFCHDVLERFHSFFITNKTNDYKAEDLRIAMQKSFKENKEKEDYKGIITKDQLNEAYEINKIYLSNILKNKFPNIISVEEKIWAPVDDKFIFLGYIDRLQLDDDGMYHVVDYKTTSNVTYLKDDTQLKLYGYFVAEKYNLKDNDKVRVSYILLKHKCRDMIKLYNVKDLKKTKNSFVEQWHILEQEKVFRAIAKFNTCSICDFVSHCQEGQTLQQRKKNFYGKEEAW